MKITNVSVEHFRGVKNASWNLNGELNVLAGPNNSGKTTILKAIELFFSVDVPVLEPTEFAPKFEYYQAGRRTLTKVRITFGELTDAEKDTFKDEYSKIKKEFWIELRIPKGGEYSWACSGKKDNAKSAYERVSERYSVLYVPVLRIGERGISSTESQRLHSTMTEILVRTRGRESEEQRVFRKKLDGALKTIRSTLDDGWKGASGLLTSDLKLKAKMPSVRKVVEDILDRTEITTNSAGDLEIKDEGTGIQSLMAIGLIKNFAEKRDRKQKLVLLEEPEAFLHPQLQRKLADFLIDVSRQCQLVVTTHSSVIIDSIDLNSIASLPRHTSGLEWNWHKVNLTDDESGHLGRFCDSKNSELVFAGKAIFCEGITDRNIIVEILESIKDEGILVDTVSVIEMGGKNTIHKFAMLAKRFNVESIFIVDRDFYKSTDRAAMRNLIKEQKWSYSPNLYNDIDSLGSGDFLSWKDSILKRDRINVLLEPLNTFVLSSDIEGSVVTSLRKEIFSDLTVTDSLLLLTDQQSAAIANMTLSEYHTFMFEKVGSKGWVAGGKKKSDLNPKPHVLAQLIRSSGRSFVKNSDLSRLKKYLRSYIERK